MVALNDDVAVGRSSSNGSLKLDQFSGSVDREAERNMEEAETGRTEERAAIRSDVGPSVMRLRVGNGTATPCRLSLES